MAPVPGVKQIIDRFRDRLEEVVERATETIWTQIPSYERAGEAVLTDLRQAVRENVATLSRVLTETREVTREELEVIERVGGRRAEAGIPLDDVLHAYRTVSRVCWDVLAETVLRYTDEISSAVAEAYSRAQRAIVRAQEGARREFLADVLYGTEAAPEDVLRRAHTFGYDLSLSYIALVGEGPGPDARNESAVTAAATGLSALLSADPIVLQKGGKTITLIPAGPGGDPGALPEKLVAELGRGWRFGQGGPGPGLDGIRRAYLEAKEALEMGVALGLDGPIFAFDDLLLYHFLRIEPALVERFTEQMLGPLITYDERRKGELVKTLEAYFAADGSVKLAGEALFAHPHTVSYRLKQVERLTGWSLRSPEDKLRLQLALRALRLARAR